MVEGENMVGENLSFIIAFGLLYSALLLVMRLVAVKLDVDPIMKRYSSRSPEYQAYKTFQQPAKFAKALFIVLLVAVVLAIYVMHLSHVYNRTPSLHYMLVLGPIAAAAIFAVLLIIGYIVLIKNHSDPPRSSK